MLLAVDWSASDEEAQRRGGSATARGKRSLARKLTAVQCKSFSV
ncbi:hypothetical protein [Priestia megaterium]|nr:hypothetical protein [Priestia megaterium]